jgi:hypothetical protein
MVAVLEEVSVVEGAKLYHNALFTAVVSGHAASTQMSDSVNRSTNGN